MGVAESHKLSAITTMEGNSCQFKCGAALQYNLDQDGNAESPPSYRALMATDERFACLRELASFVVRFEQLDLYYCCVPCKTTSFHSMEVIENEGEKMLKILRLPRAKNFFSREVVIPRLDFYDRFGRPLFRLTTFDVCTDSNSIPSPPQNQLIGYIEQWGHNYQIQDSNRVGVFSLNTKRKGGPLLRIYDNAEVGYLVDSPHNYNVHVHVLQTLDIWAKACVLAAVAERILTKVEAVRT
ncbi:uncharacterized protein [Apostichopus japonicus]